MWIVLEWQNFDRARGSWFVQPQSCVWIVYQYNVLRYYTFSVIVNRIPTEQEIRGVSNTHHMCGLYASTMYYNIICLL